MKVLRTLRKRKKMTQEDLAKLLNVDRTTVTRWETTDIFPHAVKIQQIANIFNCKVDLLFKDVDGTSRKKSS